MTTTTRFRTWSVCASRMSPGRQGKSAWNVASWGVWFLRSSTEERGGENLEMLSFQGLMSIPHRGQTPSRAAATPSVIPRSPNSIFIEEET